MNKSFFNIALQRALEDKGWSVAELGRRAGINGSSFTRWKQGVKPDFESLEKVAKALDLPVSSFLEGVRSKGRSVHANSDETSSTFNKERLTNGPMVKLQPHVEYRQQVEKTLSEIGSRLERLPESSPSIRKVLLSQINTRIQEHLELIELEGAERKSHQ